jgi:hypothetical protein
MASDEALRRLSTLSPREREVLALRCEGLTYKEIGRRLYLSESTIKTYMGRVYVKLGLDQMKPRSRAKMLDDVFCPALASTFQTAFPPQLEPPEPEPDSVPEEVRQMVEEDEKMLVLYRRPQPPAVVYHPDHVERVQPLIIIRPDQARPVRRWGFLVGGIAVGTLLVMLVMAGAFFLFQQFFGGTPTPVAQAPTLPTTTPVAQVTVVTQPVTIVVTATLSPVTQMPTSADTATSLPEPTLTPSPAHTPTPEGMVSQTIAVPDNAYVGGWYQTDMYLKQGDKVSIRYLSGKWWIGQDIQGQWSSQEPTDANGYAGRDGERATALVGGSPDRCKVLSEAPYGSLIGRVGDPGPSFLVGNSLEFESPADGLLYLGINYVNHNFKTNCPYGDDGEITVSVTVIP